MSKVPALSYVEGAEELRHIMGNSPSVIDRFYKGAISQVEVEKFWKIGREAVQESFEQRQTSTADALEELLKEVEKNEARKKEQAEKSFDGLTYFVYRSLLDAKIQNAELVSRKIRQAFADFPNWRKSENDLRELRKRVTFAIFAETDDLDQVTAMVEELFTLLEKADRI